MPFFSGTVSALQEWSYWSSQQPSEVWQLEEVPAPSFLKRVKPSGLLWGCVASLHLSRVAFEASQNWLHLYWGTGRNGEKAGMPCCCVSGGKNKAVEFLCYKTVLANSLWWMISWSNWLWTSFVEITRYLMMHLPFSFSSVLLHARFFSLLCERREEHAPPKPRSTAASCGKCPWWRKAGAPGEQRTVNVVS